MENKSERFVNALSVLPQDLRAKLISTPTDIMSVATEIILRTERPMCIESPQKRYYFTENGCITDSIFSQSMVKTPKRTMMEIFQNICNYSVYSFQNEINNGFVTMRGGHRVGLCGTAVVDNGKIVTVKDITTINIRIARECVGCSDRFFPKLNPKKGVLICGVPCSGKTTLLRDYARKLSYLYKVCVIDERNELSSTHNGIFQNDMGMCDVYDGYIKEDAIIHAIRSMSPDIIICDEISTLSDIGTVIKSINSGVSFVATLHAKNKEEVLKKPEVQKLLKSGAFSQLVFLSDRRNVGKIESIEDISDIFGDAYA